MARSGSASTQPPPPSRCRHQATPFASLAVSHLPPSPSGSVISSVGFSSSSILSAAAQLKPAHRAASRPLLAASAPPPPPQPQLGSSCTTTSSTVGQLKPVTRAEVRTRTLAKIDGKTLVLWLTATVVSATDCSYEVIYEGNLPRDDPFSSVHVPLHHVRPIKTSTPIPSLPASQPLSATVSSTNTKASASKSSRTIQPPPQPTRTTGQFVSEMKLQPADGNLQQLNPFAMKSKSCKMQSAPRPTPAGKVAHLIDSRPSKMKPAPRPSTAGKSLRQMSNFSPETKPDSRPTTAGKSIRVIRELLSEKDRQILDAGLAALQLPFK